LLAGKIFNFHTVQYEPPDVISLTEVGIQTAGASKAGGVACNRGVLPATGEFACTALFLKQATCSGKYLQ